MSGSEPEQTTRPRRRVIIAALSLGAAAALTLFGVLLGRACEFNDDPWNFGCVFALLPGFLTVLAGGLVTAVIAFALLFNTRTRGERAAVGMAVMVIGGLVNVTTPGDHWCTIMYSRACLLPTAVGPGLVCLGALILVLPIATVAARRAPARWIRRDPSPEDRHAGSGR